MAVAALAVLAGCTPRSREISRPPGDADFRRQVWAAIQPLASIRGLDPYFVYALVGAESNFEPRARRGLACGLLQIKPDDWRLASPAPFDPGVWDWHRNLAVGLDRLASEKAVLEGKGLFSYRRLWAVYHFGRTYVAGRDYEIERIPQPDDPIGRALWFGEARPLLPPK